MACLRQLAMALAIIVLVLAGFASDSGAPRAQDGDKSAEEVFSEYISEDVVQGKCVNCHVQGGLSGNTRLVFVSSLTSPDHEARNFQTFMNFIDGFDGGGGGAYILNKIQGALGHGGLQQVPPESVQFANMQRFIGLLGETVAKEEITPSELFDTVLLASNRKTLRRAALIFAGRIPTDEEYAAVDNGSESVLRTAVRGLMTGPQFHEFLLRASNDRLLTDRDGGELIGAGPYFAAYIEEHYRRKRLARAINTDDAWEEFRYWNNSVRHGARRAPWN